MENYEIEMSKLLDGKNQIIDRLHRQLEAAVEGLGEIREEYAGSELGEPVYAQEAYAIQIAKKQFKLSCDTLAKIKQIGEEK